MSSGGERRAAPFHEYRVLERVERFVGPVFRLVSDRVTMPGGKTAVRDVILHRGAVAVVARDRLGRIALLQQYRHALGRREWELPAGLMETWDGSAEEVARRELAEELGLIAGDLVPLVGVHSAPGYSNELVRVFVTTVQHDEHGRPVVVPAAGAARRDEELEISWEWVEIETGLEMIKRGEITNSICQVGLLAYAHYCR